ncbi:hypothetical protein H2204_011666 [Knufia peltigerae]|uniref:HNH nuclease domain-containing protein n=1 Tax=Knufia peltigerae TaxID=1002370 RepID=A0AA38XTT0_9EURO|nr:hypothetical protein H2204_011666 [Knufia peltigerae]
MASGHADDDRVVWSRYPQPSHPEKSQSLPSKERILILHPGYDRILLLLPRLDAGGFHHETIRIACGILVNNSWDGFFSLGRRGEDPVPLTEKILKGGKYYFQTSRSLDDLNYAITPNFGHWRFPYQNLPPSWHDISSDLSSSEQSSQPYPFGSDSCRITLFEDGVEDAYLIPRAERHWFNSNLGLYTNTTTRADKLQHPDNMIRLRSDIHKIFDAKVFTIVPIEGRLVVSCLNAMPRSQTAQIYHGVEIHQIENRDLLGEFLFARFAYTIFELLRGFLEVNAEVKLRLWIDNKITEEICDSERSSQFARTTASQGKSCSASPRKRPRPGPAGTGSAGDSGDMYSDDEDDSEEEVRGRKRRRSASSESKDWFEERWMPSFPHSPHMEVTVQY